MIVWKNREEVSTSWDVSSRNAHKTKRRSYMLWSFFTLIKTALTDPKDDKALGIKCDPAYLHDNTFWAREEANTQYKVRFRS